MSTVVLPEEVIGQILGITAPFVRTSGPPWPIRLLDIADLKSASLVCRAWRAPAQRRLFSVLRLKCRQDLVNFSTWLDTNSLHTSLPSFTHLQIKLHDRELAPSEHLTSQALLTVIERLAHVRQLYLETQLKEDDANLADIICALPRLEALVISHTWGTDRDSRQATPSDVYRDPDEGPEDSPVWWYREDTRADITSIVKYALPGCRQLKLLGLDRAFFNDSIINEANTQYTSPAPFRLKGLYLGDAACSFDALSWLLSSSQRLKLFSCSFVSGLLEEQLASVLNDIAENVEDLTLLYKWRSLKSAGAESTEALLCEAIVRCHSIKRLHIQHPQFRYHRLSQLPLALRALAIAVGIEDVRHLLAQLADHPFPKLEFLTIIRCSNFLGAEYQAILDYLAEWEVGMRLAGLIPTVSSLASEDIVLHDFVHCLPLPRFT